MIYVAGSAGVTILDAGLRPTGAVLPVDELLYLVVDPSGQWVFGVSGVHQGRAHVWRIDGDRLVPTGDPVSTGGTEPCHLVIDRTGRHLIVTNYGSGSISLLPITEDGNLGPATVLLRTAPAGPQADRQDGPHPHQAVLGPGNEVLVTDLGADEVISHLLVGGTLTDPIVSATPPGSGPRHLVRLPGDRIAVTGELDSTLLLGRRDGRRIVDWQSAPATGRAVEQRNYPSDLVASADGTRLYLANRGADTVAVFGADGTRLDEVDGGTWPRQMVREGGRLLIAATNADRIDVLDLGSGRMTASVAVAAPMCVALTSERGVKR